MKIKINKCTNPHFWYLPVVGQEIECVCITKEGDAVVAGEIVKSIDGDDDEAAGYVEKGDFTIVQDDNRNYHG